jgi:hypothetical protein
MKTITREQAKEIIFNTKGKIFSVQFIKKDGSIRDMNARRHVKKGVTGVGMSYDPAEYNLIPCFDMANDGFRMINASTIQKLKVDGTEYSVN